MSDDDGPNGDRQGDAGVALSPVPKPGVTVCDPTRENGLGQLNAGPEATIPPGNCTDEAILNGSEGDAHVNGAVEHHDKGGLVDSLVHPPRPLNSTESELRFQQASSNTPDTNDDQQHSGQDDGTALKEVIGSPRVPAGCALEATAQQGSADGPCSAPLGGDGTAGQPSDGATEDAAGEGPTGSDTDADESNSAASDDGDWAIQDGFDDALFGLDEKGLKRGSSLGNGSSRRTSRSPSDNGDDEDGQEVRGGTNSGKGKEKATAEDEDEDLLQQQPIDSQPFPLLRPGQPGWEKSPDRPPRKLPIRFRDAVGRQILWPWERAKTWQVSLPFVSLVSLAAETLPFVLLSVRVRFICDRGFFRWEWKV